jgi:hypothetical protein
MSPTFKIITAAACVALLLWCVVKLIFPLLLSQFGGVGVDVPIPAVFARRYPRLAISLFVLGGPLVVVVLIAVLWWLLRHKPAT